MNDSGDYYGHANERSGITIARQVEATNTTTRDRINDIPEEKHKEDAQQALREANDEAKEKKADEQNNSEAKQAEVQEEPDFNLEDDYVFESEDEGAADEQGEAKSKKRAAQPKEQPTKKKAKATVELAAATQAMQPEQNAETSAIAPEAQSESASSLTKKPKRARKLREPYQYSAYEKLYRTGKETRADRLEN